MDRWSDEKRRRLLSSGNRAVNATLEAHAAAAQCKPSSEADVSAKHVFVRSKYERRILMNQWLVRGSFVVNSWLIH